MRREFELFQKSIEPFLSDWNSIEVRVIAQRTRSEEWIFNSIRVSLSPESLQIAARGDLPSIPNLIVAHERFGLNELDHLIDSLSKGELAVHDKLVRIGRFDGQTWQPPSQPLFQFWNRDYCRSEFRADFACYVLRIWESTGGVVNYEDLAHVDASLRSATPPWDGLADIRENFLKLSPDRSGRTDGGTLDLIAPLGVRLSNSSVLEGSTIKSLVETNPETSVEHIGLSAIAHISGDSIMRLRRSAGEANPKDPLQPLMTIIDLGLAPSTAKLIVTYRGVDLDQKEFFGKASPYVNPRATVLDEVGGGIEELRSFVEDAKKHSFEKGIALLLHLLGFSPGYYGSTPWEAPDIVAFPDNGRWILIVECTESTPDWGKKLTKLATRNKDIQQALAGFETFPVLFSSLKRTSINTTDLEKAGKERISVVSADELPNLFRMVIEGVGTARVREYLLTHIPCPSGYGSFGTI